MRAFEGKLLHNGYRRINSNAQAYEVIKRRLKHYRKNNQRSGVDEIYAYQLDGLANINVGSYYKFAQSLISKKQFLFVYSFRNGEWCQFTS